MNIVFALSVLVLLAFTIAVVVYFLSKRSVKQPEIVISLDELPQNLNKRKSVVAQSLVEIKQDTSKIIDELGKIKEELVKSKKEIVSEIKSLKEVKLPALNAEDKVDAEDKVVEEVKEEVIEESPEANKEEDFDYTDLFNSVDYTKFYTESILPVLQKVKGTEEEKNVKVLLKIMKLFDSEGDEPSVVNDVEGDSFRKEKIAGQNVSSYDILRNINLRNHTLNVAKQMYKIVIDELSIDKTSPSLIRFLIVAFAHDLGKLKRFRPDNYSMQSHPVVSAVKLKEYLEESSYDEGIKEEMIRAVEQHHTAPIDDIGKRLKEADHKAREEEKRKVVGSIQEIQKQEFKEENRKIQPLKEFVYVFTDKLFDYINKPRTIKKKGLGKTLIYAFHFGDFIYVEPDVFISALRENINIKMPDYFYSDKDSDLQRAKLLVVNSLKQLGYISPLIKDGYIGAYFEIMLKNGKVMKSYYTPISAEILKEIGKDRDLLPKLPNNFDIENVRLASKQAK